MKKIVRLLLEQNALFANIANLAIIIGVIFAIITIHNDEIKINADRTSKSIELMFRLDEKLDKYQDIIDALDTDDIKLKILKPDGNFTDSHLARIIHEGG